MGKKRSGKETFGQYIRRRRMEKQFTLREFARQVGVSRAGETRSRQFR